MPIVDILKGWLRTPESPMTRPFAAALQAAWLAISPDARPYASEAIAAVLLDRAGLTPEDVETGRVIVVAEDGDIQDAVAALAHRVWYDHWRAGMHFEIADIAKGTRVVVADRADTMLDGADWVPAAGETGVGVIMVVAFADDASAAMRSWSTKTVVLDELTDDAVIASAVEIVTGTRPTLRSSLADITMADLRTALGPRTLANAALGMMTILRDLRVSEYERKLAERRNKTREAREVVGKKEDRKEADQSFIAEFLEKSDHERDTPLSQLAGFGEGKRWGLAVAADLAAYRRGELGWEDIDRGVLLSGPPGVGRRGSPGHSRPRRPCPFSRAASRPWERRAAARTGFRSRKASRSCSSRPGRPRRASSSSTRWTPCRPEAPSATTTRPTSMR